MRISDWSSDVCSSDLLDVAAGMARELSPFLGLAVPASLSAPPEAGKRGKKDGQGLYAWKEGRPVKPELPKDYRAPEDLQDRLILPQLGRAPCRERVCPYV